MSGGSLNYFYTNLQDHVGDFNDKELDELVSDLAELFRDREWYLSNDTGVGEWNEARDNFKRKWFTEHGRQDRIEKYLVQMAEEVRRTFGISHKYCSTCANWSEERPNSNYGWCSKHTGHLDHRSDYCDEWTDKEFQQERG